MISVILHLGYGFFRASLTAPVRRGRGEKRFLDCYRPDGLMPLSERARKLSAEFERCLGCGLCDRPSFSMGITPEAIALAGWRSPECQKYLSGVIKNLDLETLREAEASCPAEIPLVQLIDTLRGALGQADGSV